MHPLRLDLSKGYIVKRTVIHRCTNRTCVCLEQDGVLFTVLLDGILSPVWLMCNDITEDMILQHQQTTI